MGHRLSKIYTRTGDDGSTGLADGSRIEKDAGRINTFGDVDELNSLLGLLIANDIDAQMKGYLLDIQHVLFDLGGELAIPDSEMVDESRVEYLERIIDEYNESGLIQSSRLASMRLLRLCCFSLTIPILVGCGSDFSQILLQTGSAVGQTVLDILLT
ncbi:MAG: ATP:cob(I)alamin adenosyltransferase, partial [Proteobacteria bacterium]|nr:ATP:cob(I)alamin adenosyltransferase [Pseudomonadota bacterium]